MNLNESEAEIGIFWGYEGTSDPIDSRWRRVLRAVQAYATERGRLPFGASVGTAGFASAVARYLPFSLRVFTPTAIPRAVAQLERLRPSHLPPIVTRSASCLADDWRRSLIGAWLEPSAHLGTALRLRGISKLKPFPIVALHHTFSYASLLHNDFLMALLSETHPFDALVCTSRAAREALRKTFDIVSERIRRSHQIDLSFNAAMPLIPLGTDTDFFRPLEKKRARSYFALPRDKLVLLFLGRLSVTDKGDLIPWLSTLRRLPALLRDRLEVVIAGGSRPDVVDTLRGFARELRPELRVTILSPMPETMKVWLYSAADIFFSPADSVQEAFGIAPVEAMACGVPQVVSDWNGYRDTVVDGETGFLIPTYWAECDRDINIAAAAEGNSWTRSHFLLGQSVAVDCDVFARKIMLLAENEALRSRMSEASRSRAIECYEWRQIMKRYEDLLNSSLDQAHQWKGNPKPRSEPYYLPEYFTVYCHYATNCIESNTSVRISETSSARVHLDCLPYPSLSEFDPAVLRYVASRLDVGNQAEYVSMLVDDCQRNFPKLSREVAMRHLMWLVKYGIVSIETAGEAEAVPRVQSHDHADRRRTEKI